MRSLLFRFDPETTHRGAIRLAGWANGPLSRLPRLAARKDSLRQRLLGIEFPTPVGLAAGFDKDAVAPHLWARLGFGFAELGTVTSGPQPGNPRPRIFRVVQERALINRLGFNNVGSQAVAARLTRSLMRSPGIPLGINVGCSRGAIGDVAREADDIRESVGRLASFADYIAVNVSSPNTPGLRELQAPERLGRIVRAVVREIASRKEPVRPVLVKLAPDLEDSQFAEIAAAGLEAGCQGFIAVNTSIARDSRGWLEGEPEGGVSGRPIATRADACVRILREAVGDDVAIIGVGGIFSLKDALSRLASGADLLALYTGLIYEGPGIAARLARELEGEIRRRGLPDFAALRDELRRDGVVS